MQSIEGEGTVGVELYVRSELPPPARERAGAIHRRLRTLRDGGLIADVDRTEWAKRVPVDGVGTDAKDAFLSFSEWATDRGVEMTPFFGTRECFTDEHGERRDWLVVPAICLAVDEEGSLAAVYPHADVAETHTVEDGLRALERAVGSEPGWSTVTAD